MRMIALKCIIKEKRRGDGRAEAHRMCAGTRRGGACHCETQKCQKPLNAAVNFVVALALFSGARGCSGLQGDVIAPARRPGIARQMSSLYTTTVCTGSRPLPHALITIASAAVINLEEIIAGLAPSIVIPMKCTWIQSHIPVMAQMAWPCLHSPKQQESQEWISWD